MKAKFIAITFLIISLVACEQTAATSSAPPTPTSSPYSTSMANFTLETDSKTASSLTLTDKPQLSLLQVLDIAKDPNTQYPVVTLLYSKEPDDKLAANDILLTYQWIAAHLNDPGCRPTYALNDTCKLPQPTIAIVHLGHGLLRVPNGYSEYYLVKFVFKLDLYQMHRYFAHPPQTKAAVQQFHIDTMDFTRGMGGYYDSPLDVYYGFYTP